MVVAPTECHSSRYYMRGMRTRTTRTKTSIRSPEVTISFGCGSLLLLIYRKTKLFAVLRRCVFFSYSFRQVTCISIRPDVILFFSVFVCVYCKQYGTKSLTSAPRSLDTFILHLPPLTPQCRATKCIYRRIWMLCEYF